MTPYLPFPPRIKESLLILILLVCVLRVYGQTPLLDSVTHYRSVNPEKALTLARKILKESKDETIRSKDLLLMGVLYNDLSRFDSAQVFLEQSLLLYQRKGDSSGIANVYHNLGEAKENLAEYQDALRLYKQGYEIRNRLGLRSEMAASLNSVGNTYLLLNQYAEALDLYLQSLKITEALGNKNAIANTNNNIGMVYDYTGDYDKAFDYYNKGRIVYEELKDNRGLAGALNNIGLIFKNKRQPFKSIPYYERSLALFSELKSPYGIAALQNNLGVAYGLMNQYAKSLQYHSLSLATNTRIGNNDGISNSNNSIGDTYLKQGMFAKASDYYKRGLVVALQIKSQSRMAESYEGLAAAMEGKDDFKSAFGYLKIARSLRDSLLSLEKSQKLYEMEQKYESELKEKQIDLLNSETARQKFEIAQKNLLLNQRNIQLGLLLIALILLGIAIYLFYSRMQVRQAARLEAARNEKEQAIIKSVYEQRMSISKDMHDEIGSGLTHISMLSEAAGGSNEDIMHSQIKTIAETARGLVQSMNEIIWAINPKHEALDDLIIYLREQTYRYFEYYPVLYKMEADTHFPDRKLSNLQRRNLYLVTKEAVNNAMKHAAATAVSLSVRFIDDHLYFEVKDNGKGFDIETTRKFANGLQNMRSRMQEIGGTYDILSSGSGTMVQYSFSLR